MTVTGDMINVIVVDDHDVVRSGIVGWISAEADMTVIAQGSRGIQAINLVQQHQPDVLLVDLHLQDMTATDVISEIRARSLGTRVIVITGYDRNRVRFVLQSGADGYLSKEDRREVMLEAIRWAASSKSGVWVSPSALQQYLEGEHALRAAELTKVETMILTMIDQTNPEICEKLQISDGTLRNHLSRIYLKLDVQNRTEATEKARAIGLL